nr:hypothetical protein [uncultured Mediterranean phage uvMED]
MSNENKKFVISPENPDGILVDMTAEEIAQKETDIANATAEANAETQKATDQANGNQKLLDLGLTQAEATALTGYTPPVADEE